MEELPVPDTDPDSVTLGPGYHGSSNVWLLRWTPPTAEVNPLPRGVFTLSTKTIIKSFDEFWFDKECPYMIVEERGKNGDNLHYHAAGTLRCTDQAVRTNLNRMGYKGNEAYALNKGNPELMDSHFDYLCKGTGTGKEDGPKICIAHPDFTPAIISERNKIYWKVNSKLPKPKRKRANTGTMADAVLKVCRQKTANHPSALSEDQLIDITLEVAHRRSSILNAFHLKSVVNHVAYSLNPESNRIALLKNAMRF